MSLKSILDELQDDKYAYKIIVHGIHNEREVVRVPLFSFLIAYQNNRAENLVRHFCNFPIKEIITNRYTKKLTDEQYSALLTVLLNIGNVVTDTQSYLGIQYTSDKELRYDGKLKSFIDENVHFEETIYMLGFDTGVLSFVQTGEDYYSSILNFLTGVLVASFPAGTVQSE